MTDREMLLRLAVIIEPIHKFNMQSKRSGLPIAGYTIPGTYVGLFSGLYVELMQHIGSTPEADKSGTTTPQPEPERRVPRLSPPEQP